MKTYDPRIALTPAAFEAIPSTLPLGTVGYEPQLDRRGERLVWAAVKRVLAFAAVAATPALAGVAYAEETPPRWCSAAFVEATNAEREPPAEAFPCYVLLQNPRLQELGFKCVGPYSCIRDLPPGAPALKLTRLPVTPMADRLPRGARDYCAKEGTSEGAMYSGPVPQQPGVIWRCVNGAVYLCEPGADGVVCSRRSKSRVPLPSMVDACHKSGQLSVADGSYGYVWRWECRDGEPVIVGPQVIYDLQTKTTTPAKLDAQGYAEGEWQPLK